MFEKFTLTHIPTLFVASAMAFGGLMPFFNVEAAMTDFGLPPRIVKSKEAGAVMILCSGRSTCLGLIMFAFYFANKLQDVDLVLLILGGYIGAVDWYVCRAEGMPGKAKFRLISGVVIAAWGWFGMTARQ